MNRTFQRTSSGREGGREGGGGFVRREVDDLHPFLRRITGYHSKGINHASPHLPRKVGGLV